MYMITYSSPGFRVTWTSVDEHIKDDLDLQSTAQEEEVQAIILVAESMGEGTRRALNKIVQLRLRNLHRSGDPFDDSQINQFP
ncbi:uncharacterized protein [Aegilops tauschii subsp. strangulata]|uniref:uncharacterized protein isoform X1 n=1 Tax=Aegilops tauschii subsp. strangulata TaxID=200361 RepID=UPI001ABC5C6E|nr:uncharacterized protein LOC109770046 isoform X1 [Aegilops tauschii subsp. strangulata]